MNGFPQACPERVEGLRMNGLRYAQDECDQMALSLKSISLFKKLNCCKFALGSVFLDFVFSNGCSPQPKHTSMEYVVS